MCAPVWTYSPGLCVMIWERLCLWSISVTWPKEQRSPITRLTYGDAERAEKGPTAQKHKGNPHGCGLGGSTSAGLWTSDSVSYANHSMDGRAMRLLWYFVLFLGWHLCACRCSLGAYSTSCPYYYWLATKQTANNTKTISAATCSKYGEWKAMRLWTQGTISCYTEIIKFLITASRDRCTFHGYGLWYSVHYHDHQPGPRVIIKHKQVDECTVCFSFYCTNECLTSWAVIWTVDLMLSTRPLNYFTNKGFETLVLIDRCLSVRSIQFVLFATMMQTPGNLMEPSLCTDLEEAYLCP